MLVFNIRVANGSDEDAEVLMECLAEWDESFEDDETSLEVDVDELYGHADDMCEPEDLAVSIANALPNSEFVISGCIDTSERAGEYMDFVIEYKNNKLVSKSSCWYVYMSAMDFDEYKDFAEEYVDNNGEPRFTEEQFEAFKQNTYFILNSGEGDCVQEVPLESEYEIDLEQEEE